MFNYTDNSDHCVAHLINEVTVDGLLLSGMPQGMGLVMYQHSAN